ncbi:MAG: hypothetical protein KDJ43_12210 [Rhizobiaceae bacterium]|nr:hypothetical protein [Rhizobiaceae bacterium]
MKLPALPATTKGRAILAGKAIVALLAAWAVFIIIDRLFILPRESRQNEGKAIVAEETAEAAGEAARGALTVTNEVHREYVRIEETTRRNDRAIKQAAGADTRLPGVAAALRDSLCQRQAYIDDEDCQ